MSTALFDLSGRRALVTGSSQGIGLSLALGLGRAGAAIVLNGRDAAKLDGAVAELRNEGITAEAAAFDVSDAAAVKAGVDRIEAEIGPLDILVNNAGIQRRAPLEEYSVETWHELMRVNLDSVFYVGQAVARHMIGRKRGKIINIASLQSEAARYSIAPYTASKGAVKNLTKGMCTDWARHGLQVNGIGPGYFATPLNQALIENPDFDAWLRNRTPAGRWGRVEELQGAAIFLASSASDFVNGQILYVDGGVLATL
ncbi:MULTISPECIES: SDR family oxidoreductase [Methylobacterium]|mgnify:CR=1 FL=1|uniref:SDR family oxidoreductase n=1 Tax=Methylobacterium TaxID=407 RepID=UPI0008E8CF9C|nr:MULTISPECIES: SDR family oxidoreductase [Methylobacterium]MBZ6411175.1 SDR family oxidoreductase [Methylobacterium sp.]MBK3395696.1 SDR family oxidoreductase [Methylobacterium ajmalii]MBK3408000.1 SDR family oxidoreductase [Methylobacterium ajmalii]MBK3422846.1 SDR family oxidoreductase [Methylobacterium ajmalii]SFE18251.1 glucose 1-dehydrogenase [Methylobacterium sp. yr596]